MAPPTLPKIVAQREIEGIEMGVLEDGRAFLSQRGLAKVAGTAPSTITNQADQARARQPPAAAAPRPR